MERSAAQSEGIQAGIFWDHFLFSLVCDFQSTFEHLSNILRKVILGLGLLVNHLQYFVEGYRL